LKAIELFRKILENTRIFYDEFSLKIPNELSELLSKKDYPFEFQVNIILTDLKRHKNLILSISGKKQTILEGFSSSLGFSLIGPIKVWEKILNKEQTLLESVVKGDIVVPNLRVNFSKLSNLSLLISAIPEKIKSDIQIKVKG
jgi:hypothetical protein